MKLNMKGLVIAGVATCVALQASLADTLPQDPRIQTGKLANGLTWMYRQHDNPPGKLSIMIHVETGSLNESESQRGLAHFIEHMAFNGTEHYKPGELIKYFESIGMEFGADANAFTSFEQTAYMLWLPDTEEATIDKGVMTLSDYVFRAQFAPEEIDQERGIIMEEWRSGKSALERVRDKQLEQVFAGSRFANRLPIGLPEVIQNAPREEFLNYYRTWYRPENMTFLAAGDMPVEKLLPALEKWFGTHKPEGAPGEPKTAEFKLFTEPRAFVITDPELGSCEVSLTHLEPGRPPTTTEALYRTDLIELVASWLVNRRLEERVQKGEASYQDASVYVDPFFKDAVLVAASAEGEAKDWKAMLDELVVEVVRARLHGFTERELELARKELLSDAQRAVKTESTRNARSFLFQMNGALGRAEPVLSAAQHLALKEKLLPSITTSELNEDFARHFGAENFAFVVTMPQKEGIVVPDSDEVLAAAKAALEKKPEPLPESALAESLLASEPTPAEIVEPAVDEDLAISSAWLANGVRVHHRFMDYKKDQVYCSVLLAGGKIEETQGNYGVTELVAYALQSQPATGTLNSTQIRDLMTGRQVSVRASAGQDGLNFTVTGSPSELDLGLQLVHALLMDGKIEESAVKVWKQQQVQQLTLAQSFPEFRMFEALIGYVGGGDPRLRAALSKEQIEALDSAKAQAWLERLAKNASIEVAVVGQLAKDEALPLVAKYIGSLPARDRIGEKFAELRKLSRPAGPRQVTVDVATVSPKAAVAAGFIGCNESAVQEADALELASEILTSRLIKKIREELALVYSLQAGNMPAQAYEDAGLFVTQSTCDPANAAKVMEEAHRIYADFAQNGPSEEELVNAKKQIANNLDESMREPSYWFGVLRDFDYHGKNLANEKSKKERYEKMTAEQIVKVFKKYYQPARQFSISAAPSAKVDSSPETPKPPAS